MFSSDLGQKKDCRSNLFEILAARLFDARFFTTELFEVVDA